MEELTELVARAFEDADDPSLSRGLAGACWLLAESARHRDLARRLLGRAAELQRASNIGLFAGVTGLQWTVDALSHVLYEEDPDAEVALDRHLADVLRRDRVGHDLVSGLVGIGVYALANPRAGQCEALCDAIVDQLERAALRPDATQAAWLTEPALLASDTRARFPDGCLDLGLAHGVPGVAAWLAEVAVHPALAPALQARAARLLDAAIAWMLARSGDHPHGYPYFVAPDGHAVPTPRVRLAWCYGDLGIAWALAKAARACDRADWAAAGRRVGARAAAREIADSGVVDPWLCHGAGGIAHVFGCLARATGEPSYGDAEARWWQHAHALAGTAPGLLEGAAGLGLAMRRAARWDAMLLL